MEDLRDVTTHSDEQVESHPQDDLKETFAAFGLEYEANEADEAEEVAEDDSQEEELDDLDSNPGEEIEIEEPKGIKVKYNGQEVFIPEEEVAVHARKGLNYDKIENRAKEYETALDRLAKQQGYKDHADLLANLDAVEQAAAQKQQDQFDQLRQQLKHEAEEAGIDPNVLDSYLDNHPLLQQAKEVVSRSQQEQELRRQQEEQNRLISGWESLFKKYPHLTENVPQDGSKAEWLTPEMENRLARGYDPIDAYELVHRDTIFAEQRKKTEQAVLKNQRLNKRAQVESRPSAELEPEAPQELVAAFAAFGLNPKAANKYAKSFKK